MIDSKPIRIHADSYDKMNAIAIETDMKLITLMDKAINYFIKHRQKVMKTKKPLVAVAEK